MSAPQSSMTTPTPEMRLQASNQVSAASGLLVAETGLPEPPDFLSQPETHPILETWRFVQQMFRDIHFNDCQKPGNVGKVTASASGNKARRREAPYISLGLQYICQQCMKKMRSTDLSAADKAMWKQATSPALQCLGQFLKLDTVKQSTDQWIEHGRDISLALFAFEQAQVFKEVMEERHGVGVGRPNLNGWKKCEEVWALILRFVQSEPRGHDRLSNLIPELDVIQNLRDVQQNVRTFEESKDL